MEILVKNGFQIPFGKLFYLIFCPFNSIYLSHQTRKPKKKWGITLRHNCLGIEPAMLKSKLMSHHAPRALKITYPGRKPATEISMYVRHVLRVKNYVKDNKQLWRFESKYY